MISIEVVVPRSTVEGVYAVLTGCCAEGGDLLLGRRGDSQTGEVLVLVHLTDDNRVSTHLTILTKALEQHAIQSFQFVQGCLVKVAAPDIGELLAHFPFSLGDTWVPSLNDTQSVYLCLHRRMMTPQQAAWLLEHSEDGWSYV